MCNVNEERNEQEKYVEKKNFYTTANLFSNHQHWQKDGREGCIYSPGMFIKIVNKVESKLNPKCRYYYYGKSEQIALIQGVQEILEAEKDRFAWLMRLYSSIHYVLEGKKVQRGETSCTYSTYSIANFMNFHSTHSTKRRNANALLNSKTCHRLQVACIHEPTKIRPQKAQKSIYDLHISNASKQICWILFERFASNEIVTIEALLPSALPLWNIAMNRNRIIST